jgi:hypothetical protein
LRRANYIGDYAVALEVQPTSGRLHGHVLLIEPAGRSGYVPKPWLDKASREVGLGWAFITEVRDIPCVQNSLLGYLVKGAGGDDSVQSSAIGEIGSYMAKAHEMARLHGLARTRLRPFRVSRGWPLSLSEATLRLHSEMFGAESDQGPWVFVQESQCAAALVPLRQQQRLERDRANRWQLARSLLDM